MSRREIALHCIDINNGEGLELGPLFDPIVSKEEANISYVDHVSTEDLKKKYKNHPIKTNSTNSKYLGGIVPVDYALEGNTLKATLKGKRYDYVLASHVIEHIPDIVSWLTDVNSILKDGGVLSLVIPDKRFTFDIMRNESRPADVVGAYLDKHTRASSVVMYDYMTNFRLNMVAAEVWDNPYADYSTKKGLSKKRGFDICLENLIPGNYVDAHCFTFTPYSFFEIIRSLMQHDLFDYEIAYFKDTPKYELEFYVSLRKSQKSTRSKKLRSIPRLSKPKAKHDLEQEIIKLTKSKSDLEKRLKEINSKLNNVITSKSWKITKPFRATVSFSRKILRD